MGALLKTKVGLVTGCRTGIGKVIAERFAEEGAVVYANARVESSLDDWARQISDQFDGEIIPTYFDVTNTRKSKEALMQIKKESGQIDYLVNNAGVVRYEILAMTNLNSVREMFEVNVLAVLNLIQITSRIMTRNNSGSIINISSVVGDRGVSGQLGYAATKGAVNSMTKSASKELAKNNIRVNSVAPGMVATERFEKVLQEKLKDSAKEIRMGRLATPIEIADACLYFASNLSEYVTGQVLEVDGSLRI